MRRPYDTLTLTEALRDLCKAADDLLDNARDRGECFIADDHEDYDPRRPETMYDDWPALDEATDKARLLLDQVREGESHV